MTSTKKTENAVSQVESMLINKGAVSQGTEAYAKLQKKAPVVNAIAGLDPESEAIVTIGAKVKHYLLEDKKRNIIRSFAVVENLIVDGVERGESVISISMNKVQMLKANSDNTLKFAQLETEPNEAGQTRMITYIDNVL